MRGVEVNLLINENEDIRAKFSYVACSEGVFRVFTNVALPRMLFRLFPSLFRVRIQDGARLIMFRSLAKIRLHCRLSLYAGS